MLLNDNAAANVHHFSAIHFKIRLNVDFHCTFVTLFRRKTAFATTMITHKCDQPPGEATHTYNQFAKFAFASQGAG